jgi:hypothetical protein
VIVENLPETYPDPCAGDRMDIIRSSGLGAIAFLKYDKQRVIVLEEVKGETVTMGFSIPATEFDEFAPEAQKVMDSVKWGGS